MNSNSFVVFDQSGCAPPLVDTRQPYKFDGKTFTADASRPWSPVRYATAGPTRKYDLHPDGKRAIVASPDTTGATTYDKVVFVFNFFDELRRLLPPGR